MREREAIEAEAWQWLIRLDGDEPLSQVQLDALRAWIGQSSAHRDALTEISRFWNKANILAQLEVPLPSRRWGWNGILGPHALKLAAGVALLGIGIAISLWWRGGPIDLNGMYSTTIGQQRTLELADGSTAQINTDSQLKVEYSEQLRKVNLLRGEAFFTVAPNAKRPFEVYAADGVIRAVGTAFAVHVQGTQIDVTVTKGQVDVAPATAGIGDDPEYPGTPVRRIVSLKAGQTASIPSPRARAQPAQARELTPPELQQRLSWHEGYWVFNGQPLDAVVHEINRYSPVALEIADPKLAKVAVGGRFKVGDLDAFYDVLQTNFGILPVRVDDRHIELRAAPAR